jgi:peptidyl-prolyl cis-trans isomerase B (cyclophilin B)
MRRLTLLLLPLFALALLVGCAPKEEPKQATSDASAPYSGPLLSGMHRVTLHTTLGDVTLALDADSAPKTVTNFVTHARNGYYDNLTFHRVIPDFMIQGGDPEGNGSGGESIYGETFEDEINAESYGLHERMLRDEAGDQVLPEQLTDATVQDYYEMLGYAYNPALTSLPMERGAVAMANRGPNTNGSQFFIIQRSEGTPWLEGKHTVFGTVVEGMDVVDAIAGTERDDGDRPLDPVTFTVEVLEN